MQRAAASWTGGRVVTGNAVWRQKRMQVGKREETRFEAVIIFRVARIVAGRSRLVSIKSKGDKQALLDKG